MTQAAPVSTLHVTFSPSEASLVNGWLHAAGSEDKAVCLSDDFSLGPILAADAERRARWVQSTLGCQGWEANAATSETLLRACSGTSGEICVWFSPWSTCSHAGFLWWLNQADLSACKIRVFALDRLSWDGISKSAPNALRPAPDDLRLLTDRWRRLQAEDAALRVIEGGRLVSARIDHFDEMLLDGVTSEWQSMASLVGRVFKAFGAAGLMQTNDLVLRYRLASLVSCGVLESRGDPADLRSCELRLTKTGEPRSSPICSKG